MALYAHARNPAIETMANFLNIPLLDAADLLSDLPFLVWARAAAAETLRFPAVILYKIYYASQKTKIKRTKRCLSGKPFNKIYHTERAQFIWKIPQY
jgi:hypothetical protein